MKGKKIQKWFLMGIFGVLMGLGITKPLCVKAQVVYPGKIEITEEGKKFKYYDSKGSAQYVADDFRRVNNIKYYFDEKGIMKTGWIMFHSQKYYANSNGEILTGWQKIGGYDYFFYPSGMLAYGTIISNQWAVGGDGKYIGKAGTWKQYDDKWCYLKYNGKWACDEICTIGTSKYYFNDYYMVTGWFRFTDSDGKTNTYYASSNGKLVTGWQTINGKRYYFDKNGKMAQNERVFGMYDFDENGIQKATVGRWKMTNGKWWYDCPGYYKNAKTGAVTYEKYPKNTIYWIKGKKYFFDEKGYMITGWLDVKKFKGYVNAKPEWVYIKPDGSFYPVGWQQIGKHKYFVENEDGKIATNKTIGVYVFDSNGYFTIKSNEASVVGWKKYSAGWRYEFTDGSYYASGIHKINGRAYAFDSEGHMLTGWVDKNTMADTSAEEPVWYYFDSNGYGANGWRVINGATYYFRDGLMARDEYVQGRYIGHNGKYTGQAPVYVDSRTW